MSLEVEEAFPSFSTERMRSKSQLREGPVTQRRLDYNAPLLSVRRLADGNGAVKSKMWKLSGELSKEPLRVPGAVPFTWEHAPGQPKQPESPPRVPSSPSPPSTPSPLSTRRASPASPTLPHPPPPLQPLFVRSNSSTLFAPPPPPPLPPPLPRIHPLPPVTRRTATHPRRTLSAPVSRIPPPPPPPLPPPPPQHHHTPSLSQACKQSSTILISQHVPDHTRMGAFRLVDPTDGFLRVLRARREKAEPHEFLAAEAASEKVAEQGDCLGAIASEKDKASCIAVDAIVERFLQEHPDVSKEEASAERGDVEGPQTNDQASVDAGNSVNLPYEHGKHNGDRPTDVADASNSCSMISSTEQTSHISISQVACSDEASEEMQKGGGEYMVSALQENGGSPCAPVSSSVNPRDLLSEAQHKQSVIKKQQNRRRISSIAILDSCRVESLQFIKSAFLELCRKAAAASMRTLAKAKRQIVSRRCSNSLDVVVHPNPGKKLTEDRFDLEEEARVREVNTVVQEQCPQQTQQQEALVLMPNNHPIVPSRPSTDILQKSSESNLCDDEINKDVKRECAPISSPKPSSESSPFYDANEAAEKDITSSSSHHSQNAKSGCAPIFSPKSSSGSTSPCLETNEVEKRDIASSPCIHHSPDRQGSPGLQLIEQEEGPQLWSRTNSVRHVYAKSLGGDEPNEFYDASSRFGSRGSTPSRIHLNRSMSKDWSIADDFLDATSSPFETPRTSVSDIRYTLSSADLAALSPSIASKMGSRSRPTSKLSKRVGKSLWVETRETDATRKVDGVSNGERKRFMSGELYPTSNENDRVLNRMEVNGTRRKWVSGDQASTSTSDVRSQYKRDIASRRMISKSIAVTPVFPSKCQKNRLIPSASGLPQQISTVDISEMGWPLGISGYPPLKINTKMKEERKERGVTKGESNMAVPLPPLPASPAGGSWLSRALSTNTLKQAPGLARWQAVTNRKAESCSSSGKKWEDIVKGSHVQPGHLRFSEELQHQPPSNSTANKYVAS